MIIPETIDRYEIQKLLGKGGQGAVLLARDSELDRLVALKLLHPDDSTRGGELVSEARIVSRLQHPNIVTLYDVGNYQGLPYLVLEYIHGESLENKISREGALGLRHAVILTSQILAGISYLHENDVLHRDLTPANILLTSEMVPKVTDFGLSRFVQRQSQLTEVAGTLRYMAPEVLLGEQAGPYSDVFALASLFYEMLTGQARFNADSPAEILNAIVNDSAIDADALGLSLDAHVVTMLATASQRNTNARYPNARAMKLALDEYRLPRDGDAADDPSGTTEYVMRRIARKKGFSSLSGHITEVYKLTSDDSVAPAKQLVNVLAKDITLSQKVLMVANSAQFGRPVNDLPRAVALLGVERVRNCVTTALMEKEFELGSVALRECMLTSFHSAMLSKSLAKRCGVKIATDAYTAGLFHDLGRTLTIHYLEEDYAEIIERSTNFHSEELTESRVVLGLAYHELGMAVGVHWRLAPDIITAMRPVARGNMRAADTPAGQLANCAAIANAVSQILRRFPTPEERRERVEALLVRAEDALNLELGELDAMLPEVADYARKYTTLLRLPAKDNATAAALVEYEPIATESLAS